MCSTLQIVLWIAALALISTSPPAVGKKGTVRFLFLLLSKCDVPDGSLAPRGAATLSR